MKKIYLLFILIFICANAYCAMEMNIPYISQPTIDGKISENEWVGATRVTGFHLLGLKALEPNQSYVYVGYDNDYFYLAYRFYGPNKPKGINTGNGGMYYLDDSIEFFFNADTTQNSYYQIMANGAGGVSCYGYSIADNGSANDAGGKLVNLDIEYMTSISPSYQNIGSDPENLWWEGEMKVSLKSMKYSVAENQKGFLFLTRDCFSGEVYNSDYGYAKSNFHEKDKYTKITFTKNSPNIQMNKSDIVGFDNTYYNFTGEKTIVEIENILSKDGNVVSNKKTQLELNPNESKSFAPEKSFPKGVYNLDIIAKDEKGNILLQTENEIINIDVFKWEIRNNKLIIDTDMASLSKKNNPFMEIKVMKDSNMLNGWTISVKENEQTRHFELDLSQFKPGEYTISSEILGLFSKKDNFTVN